MSATSNMSKSVASASPTLVHFTQQLVHGPHQANLLDIAANARNFGVIPGYQETDISMQDLNKANKSWGNQLPESRRSQQLQSQPWIHYGPPTLSPIQASPRCFPENEDPDGKGQKRPWSDMCHGKSSNDKERKKLRTVGMNQPHQIEPKDHKVEYRKAVVHPGSLTYTPVAHNEVFGYLSPSDPGKSLQKDLQQKLMKIDGEVARIEQIISNLKEKCNDLSKEKMLSEVEKIPEVVVEVPESRPQTIARLIYSQNKLKAQQSHNSLSSLGTATPLPLYNQPSDTLVYHENKKRFQSFKKVLVAHLAKRHQAEKIRIRYLSERYNQLHSQWVKKLNKRENSSCRKEKDAKFREFFEKVFPDLKKLKDDKEKLQRFTVPGSSNRPAGYARSDAGIEEIVNELHEQEVKEKRMVSLSVTPPMLLDSRQRSMRIIDETRLIRSFDFRQKLWTNAESEIFAEKYQQFPKKFGVIASFLENKTVEDCVLFYYLMKKAANYKSMARRYQTTMKKRDKKFRPAASNVQNQENKSGCDVSSLSEPSTTGFSYMSTILLPTSYSLTSATCAATSTTTSSAPPCVAVSAAGTSSVEAKSSSEVVKEAETLADGSPELAAVATVVAAVVDEVPDSPLKAVPASSEPDKENIGRESSSLPTSAEKSEEKSEEELLTKEDDLEEVAAATPAASVHRNSSETKNPLEDPGLEEHDPPSTVPPQLSHQVSPPLQLPPPPTEPPPRGSLVTSPEADQVAVVTPASDNTTTPYAFSGMRLEDISDKEDSDSVATLSADEGPTLPPEDKEPPQVVGKRPRLIDDSYRDQCDTRKFSEDVISHWDAKQHPSSSLVGNKRHFSDDNPLPLMNSVAERERRSLPLSEYPDAGGRQLDSRGLDMSAYQDAGQGDLLVNLMRKNRSPARIRDLIHAAIEKNLQTNSTRQEGGDLNGSASPHGGWSSRGETPVNRLSSPLVQPLYAFSQNQQQQLQQHFQQQFQHPKPQNSVGPESSGDFPTSRHLLLCSPTTNDLNQQQHAMKLLSHDRPNSSYSPARFQSPHQNNQPEALPPPAHSHHHQQMKNANFEKVPSRNTPGQYLENNRLYELAVAATEFGRLDDKEKRIHKESLSGREPPPPPPSSSSYPGNLPPHMMRPPYDPILLHQGLSLRNSSGIQSTGPPVPLPNVHPSSGRGSITKGTSGRSEAIIQQHVSSGERQMPHSWQGPPRTTSNYSVGALAGLPHPPLDYLSSAQVLRGDFLTAQQMVHYQQFQLQQQQQQHYAQGLLNRPSEKKLRQSPAASAQESYVHNKNHAGLEPARKKPKNMVENVGKGIYVEQSQDYPHKKPLSLDDIQKQIPSEQRTHSRSQQHPSLHYYNNPSEVAAAIYPNESQRPKSTHQQNINLDSSKAVADVQKFGKKETQVPSQMTAANLIEAIIYLQINRNESEHPALKMAQTGIHPSTVSNPLLQPHVPSREESTPVERLVRNQPGSSAPGKLYDRLTKPSQSHAIAGESTLRPTSDNRNQQGSAATERGSSSSAATERGSSSSIEGNNREEAVHHHPPSLSSSSSVTKHHHNKDPSSSYGRRFAPYGHLDYLLPPPSHRSDAHFIGPTPSYINKKVITASDRIEAIIAQDIGSQDNDPNHSEDIQSAIKEYMKVSDSRTSRFDPIDPSHLPRFSHHNRSYNADTSFLPFFPQAALRMPCLDDKPPSISTQNDSPPKIWNPGQGNSSNKLERNSNESGCAKPTTGTGDLKTADTSAGYHATVTRDPAAVQAHQQLTSKFPAQEYKKSPRYLEEPCSTSLAVPHAASLESRASSSFEKSSGRDSNNVNISIPTPSTRSSPVLTSPHINWKTKMLRQHKEQNIAENSLTQQSQGEETSQNGNGISQDGMGVKPENNHNTGESAKEEFSKSEKNSLYRDGMQGVPHENNTLSQHQATTCFPSSDGNAHLLSSMSDSRNEPPILSASSVASNYWSSRSSTGKCSSESSDGLRIDLPNETEEDFQEKEKKE